jgi:hypothetical protein
MGEAADRYEQIADELEASAGAARGTMFGMPVLKTGAGKAFSGLYGDAMTFKLPPEPREQALALAGARLFDPSGRRRPMKEWAEVPVAHAERWPALAREAARYVGRA